MNEVLAVSFTTNINKCSRYALELIRQKICDGGVVVRDGGVVRDVGDDVRDGDVHDGVADVRDVGDDVRANFFLGTASLFNFLFLFNPSNSACKSLSKSLSSKCSAHRRKSFLFLTFTGQS